MSSGTGDMPAGRKEARLFPVAVTGLTWLANHAFEIRFQRPDRFVFVPGQKISVAHNNASRDYSLINSRDDIELAICVRLIPDGLISPVLARAKPGDMMYVTAAFGYFFYQPSPHPAVFVATGTGVAPFVAFVRAGAEPYHLMHGVRSTEALYYRELLVPRAKSYTACISDRQACLDKVFTCHPGRVTDMLEQQLAPQVYDFYLCGRSEMVRDATQIIDRRFGGSRVFSEVFF